MIHLFKLSANSLIHASIHDEEKQDFYVPLCRLYTGMSDTWKKPPAAIHIFHTYKALGKDYTLPSANHRTLGKDIFLKKTFLFPFRFP